MTHAVRENAGRIRRKPKGNVHDHHDDGNQGGGNPDALRPQYKKGFAEASQGKDSTNGDNPPILTAESPKIRPAQRRAGLRLSADARFVNSRNERNHGKDGRNRRDPEY